MRQRAMAGRGAGLLMALLAGCSPQIVSTEPLFESAGEQLRPGLWALLTEDCAAPAADAGVFDWPECALPVRVRPGELAVIRLAPVRVRYRLAEGAPAVVQARITEQVASEDRSIERDLYGYFSFQGERDGLGAAGDVRILRCPDGDEPPIAGLALVELPDADERRCLASSAEAVREAARQSLAKPVIWRARWIAPLP